ncbi:WD repeat protein 35 [Loa loa]|uniref:WD repeat protein 35 n=1 Tax=Loa loa TaxID=7209 RepID=A0A1S0UF24_LOALO|nr:WD repeat protein 35 [Loa loa]EJD74175.1 WD repeat protein 35 [Loa loa]
MNQNLDGHSNIVHIAEWNECCQKLTTCDSNGLIIVWLTQSDSWYEEMINKRNKSVVVGMAWSHNGSKIAIAYEDGQAIVGSVDGNRLWNKNVASNLVALCWSGDSSSVLFGLIDGEIHTYDATGVFMYKLRMACIENVELETALNKDLRRVTIASMEWFIPLSQSNLLIIEFPVLRRCYIPDDRPRFLVAYNHGIVQLMRHENDSNPVIIKLPNMILSKARWSPDGSMLAICGVQTDSEDEKCMIHFATAYGEPLRNLSIPGQTIADISWEGDGLRLCAAVDSHLFFVNIRPDYKWAYCGQTVIYSYEKVESKEHFVVFFQTKLEEAYLQCVKPIVALAASNEHCILISRVENQIGQYLMQICNGIGTTIDSKYINLEPKYVVMNDSEVVIANNLSFTIWQYNIPCATSREVNLSVDSSSSDQKLYYVDENDEIDVTSSNIIRGRSQRQKDEICALAISKQFILVCRNSGTANYYSLPEVKLQSTLNLGCCVEKLELNCNGTRLAALTTKGLKLFELRESTVISLYLERSDVWNIKWDSEKDDTIAVMEKTRLYVVRNKETEEPVVNNGYICSFKNLIVRTVLLDELMKNPETPHKSFIIDVEIKLLRNVKNLLEKMKIDEATAFIERNNHPKLWALLAEVALNRLDTVIAEHAFVMLKDYAGIQLIKRIGALQHDGFKKAEVAAFYGRIDEAEKIYMENDRRDLAIELREKMNDWFRIVEILQKSRQPGDDELLKKAWNHIGDYYAERQKWKQAESYYEKGENHEQLIRCYLMDDNYDNMELLAKRLPDGDKLISEIGEIFVSAGLCEQAVQCFVRCGMLNEALDACIQLNQWEQAVQLSKTYNLRDVHLLLNRYAEQLTGSNEKTLAAVQLYRRAGKYLEAARIIFDIANNERLKQAEALRLKKLYVMGALLVEQYHEQSKSEIARESTNKSDAEIALKGLLEEDSKISLADSTIIDNAWRGAEAYHFYMLAHRQLYNGDVEKAMMTALHLTDYEDLIDPAEIYSLLALSSCVTRQFAVCSRAFIKLESLETFTADEKETYKKLAIKIFTKYPPKDTRMNKVECVGCYAQIQDYCQVCPSCDIKFPTCVVTGRPLLAQQFWLCPTCKHRAYEEEINLLQFCPLCHGKL